MAAVIAATGASSANKAKHALPLPLIWAATPNLARSNASKVGNAMNFAPTTSAMLLLKSSSAFAPGVFIHAASRVSACVAGR